MSRAHHGYPSRGLCQMAWNGSGAGKARSGEIWVARGFESIKDVYEALSLTGERLLKSYTWCTLPGSYVLLKGDFRGAQVSPLKPTHQPRIVEL